MEEATKKLNQNEELYSEKCKLLEQSQLANKTLEEKKQKANEKVCF